MRVLAPACLPLLASCFGPTVLDGSFFCLDGDECPPGMFCRTDCNPQKCFFDTTTACPADAGVIDAPAPTTDSALPPFDGPVVVVDAPSPFKDGPVIGIIDAGIITIADAPVIRIVDAGLISTDALVSMSMWRPPRIAKARDIRNAPDVICDIGDGCYTWVACGLCDCPDIVYPTDRTQSPITDQVVAAIQAIVANDPTRNEHAYTKVGDSNSANGAFMRCFDTPEEQPYYLGAYPELQATIDWFRFSHMQYGPACRAGTTATDVITGNPSPLAQIAAPSGARYAVIMFGTNQEPLAVYEASMRAIVAQCIAAGIVPILNTIPDCLPCALRPNTPFNDIVRRIAEENRIPLIDLRRESNTMPGSGLVDGIHFNVVNRGGDFTAAGLQYGFDRRNLLTLQALARAKLAVEGVASDPSGCRCPKCLRRCPAHTYPNLCTGGD